MKYSSREFGALNQCFFVLHKANKFCCTYTFIAALVLLDIIVMLK